MATGDLTIFSGWIFKPMSYTGAGGGTRPPQVLVADDDWRYFGVWLRGPDDSDPDDPDHYDIRTFADGSERFSGDMTELTGRATYIGPAGGYYVDDAEDEAGLFTAKVTLHADFGASPRVHGVIDDFRRDGGGDLGWDLFLDETPITGAAFDGTTSSNGRSGLNTGRYDGAFYGNGNNGYPNGAVGTFDGKFDDGLVIGAFGSTRHITDR